MQAITGVFTTRPPAEAALQGIQQAGIKAENVTLLTPGSAKEVAREVAEVPVDAAEQPGMGKAVGALVGGGIGLTGGAALMALVPGVGPVTALGLLGTAILGAAGATAGAAAGSKAEDATYEGLPEDEIFVYEDALRKGRCVVVALVENEDSASRVREILQREGAESIDAARDQWWIGLRSGEQNRYTTSNRSFSEDEQFFRMGFQAAMHAKTRCREFDQVLAEMDAALENAKANYPNADLDEPFLQGYRRGREYYQQLCDEDRRAA